ncbi:MAG: hypothetical protein C7B46_19540 [Sulfobacillus benefaciens]|uniref:Peptidase M50 domain-containing protein n=1 Tax=Sulfobacillus benefaciens TaxID=453960 RepID=A0A2T2WYB9_9FIRM|nr:MAG: hypothetical protein C7B46_19540 [Sulfobacillus benefaciens]
MDLTIHGLLYSAVALLGLVLVHELGHIIMAQCVGVKTPPKIKIRGIVAIGVAIDTSKLSRRAIAYTLIAGSWAEWILIPAIFIEGSHYAPLLVILIAAHWAFNWIPWGILPNDGTRLWRL